MLTLGDAVTFQARLGDPQVLAEYLGRPGVLRSGHFRLLSGLHTDQFIAFSRVATDSSAVTDLANTLAAVVAPWGATGVLAPSTAGVALGGALAERLGVSLHLASLDEKGRAESLIASDEAADRRLLLVNDIVTTGHGLVALARAARASGAQVAGAAWFASRAPVDVEALIDAPTAAVVSLDLPCVQAEHCPGCAAGVPAEDALDLN